MTHLERITERISRRGDVNDPATPRPLLTLEEFFEGNDVSGSICCNLSPMPEPAEVRSRPNVADVRVEVAMFDMPEWPFAETVWVITSASSDDVKSWFESEMTPDDVWSG